MLLNDLRQALGEHPDRLATLVVDWAVDWADAEAVVVRVVSRALQPHDNVVT